MNISVRLRLLVVALAAAIAAVAIVAGPGASAASSCEKKKEKRGCKLRKGTTYSLDTGAHTVRLVQGRGSWTLSWNSFFDCESGTFTGTPSGDNYPTNTRGGGERGTLRVGRTYTVTGSESGTTEDGEPDAQSWEGTIKINSARTATLTFTQTRTTAGELRCQGGGKLKAKRTK